MQQQSFHITQEAWERLGDILKDEPPGTFFRVTVQSGGCSGLQYQFTLDQTQDPNDRIFRHHTLSVVVDATSLPFLEKAQLDYTAEMMGKSFQITNALAKSSCGCGNSFSIEGFL